MAAPDKHRKAAEPPDLGESSIDWRELWHLFLARSWLVAICVIAGFFAATAYVRRIPQSYRATSVLQFDSEEKRLLGFEDGQRTEFTNETGIQTIIETFRSRTLLEQVVESQALHKDPAFLPLPAPNQPRTVEETAKILGAFVDVQIRRGTRLIDVSAIHPNPQMAQKLADAFTQQFIQFTIEQRASSSKAVLRFLLSEAERSKAKLQKSEEALHAYKESHNASSLEERQDTVVAKLKSQSNQLTDAKAARIRLEADDQEVNRLGGDPTALLSLSSVANSPAIIAVRQRMSALESQIATLALRYTDKHPKMIQARTQLTEAKSALTAAAAGIPSLVHSEYERALATEKSFEAALRDQEKQALELNKQGISYNVIAREVETDRALYDSLLRRLKETDVAKGVELSNVRVFEAAALPSLPVDQKPFRFILIGIGGGFLLGLAGATGGHFFDSSWRNVVQAEGATGLPVLAAIPRCRHLRGWDLRVRDPGSPTAEAFRSLRTGLQLVARKEGDNTFLFTSSVPEEGKTFCALNYALAAAQQGLRTLVIDADLRAPMVGGLLLGEHALAGVAEYVRGEVTFEQAIHTNGIANLSVLPAGGSAPNPAEMLASAEFGRLIAEARASYDCVVVDSPPIHAVSDGLLILEHASSVCLVVRTGRTPRELVLRACRVLSEFGVRPVGLVMNDVPARGIAPYYAVSTYGTRGYRS